MRVTARRWVAVVSAALVAGPLSPGTIARAEGDGRVSLDLYVFSQSDDGGDPYKAEGMNYGGARVGTQVRLSDEAALHANATVALLINDDVLPPPPTVTGLTATSASSKVVTLDAGAAVEIKPTGSGWTISPGAYYHHQYGFIGGGVDLDASRELLDGNTVLAFSYSFRLAFPKRRMWNGAYFGFDHVTTSNLLVGVTQILSPSVLVGLSGQYTRQDGLLSEPYNFLVLFDRAGDPRQLVDESLPRVRNRGQLNARLRYTPALGTSLGLDASFYADDWAILHGAFEPSVEVMVPWDIRLRVWCRLSIQRQTEYFLTTPLDVPVYGTQDSDLGSFVMLSPGLLVTFPLYAAPGELGWEMQVSGYGFWRDDDVFAVGSNLGVAALW